MSLENLSRCRETPSDGKNIVTGIGYTLNGHQPTPIGALLKRTPILTDCCAFPRRDHGTIYPDPQPTEAESPGVIFTTHSPHTSVVQILNRAFGMAVSKFVGPDAEAERRKELDPPTFVTAGLYVSHTSRLAGYTELSSELMSAMKLISTRFPIVPVFALQTENKRGEGGFAWPLRSRFRKNLLISNWHIYRVKH